MNLSSLEKVRSEHEKLGVPKSNLERAQESEKHIELCTLLRYENKNFFPRVYKAWQWIFSFSATSRESYILTPSFIIVIVLILL